MRLEPSGEYGNKIYGSYIYGYVSPGYIYTSNSIFMLSGYYHSNDMSLAYHSGFRAPYIGILGVTHWFGEETMVSNSWLAMG